jgi:hypothetical protein
MHVRGMSGQPETCLPLIKQACCLCLVRHFGQWRGGGMGSGGGGQRGAWGSGGSGGGEEIYTFFKLLTWKTLSVWKKQNNMYIICKYRVTESRK